MHSILIIPHIKKGPRNIREGNFLDDSDLRVKHYMLGDYYNLSYISITLENSDGHLVKEVSVTSRGK